MNMQYEYATLMMQNHNVLLYLNDTNTEFQPTFLAKVLRQKDPQDLYTFYYLYTIDTGNASSCLIIVIQKFIVSCVRIIMQFKIHTIGD